MKSYKKIYLLALVVSLSAALALGANAAGTDSGTNQNIHPTIENPFKCSGTAEQCGNLITLFTAIVEKVLLPIGGVVAVVSFIWVGFMFVTAQGEPAKLETAKRGLLYTAVGTAVLLGAEVIAKVIDTTINSLRT